MTICEPEKILHPMPDDRLYSVEEQGCLTMPGDRITCREFVELAGAYHEGELPAAQCRLSEEHLAECQKCRDYLEAYRATIMLARDAMADLGEQAVPEEFGESNPPLSAFAGEMRVCAHALFFNTSISFGRGPINRTLLRTPARC